MTGNEIYKYFQQKAGSAYTGSLSSVVQQNNLFKDALISSIEKKYSNLITQKTYDDIGFVIKTEKSFTPTSNIVKTNDTTLGVDNIDDYWHLLAVKAKFTKISDVNIVKVDATSPIVITLDKRSNFATGQKVAISSVIGIPAANGTYYLKRKNDYKFALYINKDLTVPTSGVGLYNFGGKVSRVYDNYCVKVFSDQKTGIFNKNTIVDPGFEETENQLKIYPLDEPCSNITIDYISTPPTAAIINTADTTINLDQYYPEKFQFYIIDEAIILFAKRYRDTELMQTAMVSQQQND